MHLPYKDDFSLFIHVYKKHFMILYGYCLKPVQLFASRLARYRAFGFNYIQLYAIFKNWLQVSMGNHFCLGICTKVMKTLHRHFHSPVSSKMEMKVQRKDVLFLSEVSFNYRKKLRGFPFWKMHIT